MSAATRHDVTSCSKELDFGLTPGCEQGKSAMVQNVALGVATPDSEESCGEFLGDPGVCVQANHLRVLQARLGKLV